MIQPLKCTAFTLVARCLLQPRLVIRCRSLVQCAETLRRADSQSLVDHLPHGIMNGQTFFTRANERPASQLGIESFGIAAFEQRIQYLYVEVAQRCRCFKCGAHLLWYAF